MLTPEPTSKLSMNRVGGAGAGAGRFKFFSPGGKLKPLTLVTLVYVLLVLSYGIWSYITSRNIFFRGIDDKLYYAASNIKHILPEDFHDRALERDSISEEENLRNGRILSDYVNKTGIIYAYTMVKREGKVFFTSTSNTADEIARGDISPYFESYEEASPTTLESFDSDSPLYDVATDRWGSFRSVLIRQKSPKGNIYVAGADIDIAEVNSRLRSLMWRSITVSVVFVLLSVPFVLAYLHSSREQIEEFENLREMLHQKAMHRTMRIEKKIDEFIRKK
ncbi:MAG: hypothetical protein JW808_04855 [Victivallales bacterium]|nr:hypothetical protein [Victivallales bacterium]